MSKRVLISGVSGFIGAETALQLVKSGYDVYGFSRQSFQFRPALEELRGKISFYQADLTDYASLVNIVRDIMPDYVIHTGAITPVSYSFEHPWNVTQTNYIGTINFSEALRKYCPNLRKFIFISGGVMLLISAIIPWCIAAWLRRKCPLQSPGAKMCL